MSSMTNPTDRDELEPCPFCGGAMEAVRSEHTGQIAWIQHRDDQNQATCPLEFGGMDDGLPPIVAAWNRRATPQAGDELARELERYANFCAPGAIDRADLDGMAFAMRGAAKALTASGNDVLRYLEDEARALDDKAVRQLLADIARLASDYEIGDDIDREDLGAYFEWRNCMDLADAYGRGVEQQYFDEIASAYGLPPSKRPCATTTPGA